MGTRANIIVEGTNETPKTIYYKHYDGYINGGLGEQLAEFVKDNEDIRPNEFMTKFIVYQIQKYGTNSYVENIQLTDQVHGDIEFVYVFNAKTGLGVYVRESFENLPKNYLSWKYLSLNNMGSLELLQFYPEQ
mgnify:FL=1|jgi:hypothetical protein|tara:strand:+ start:322 stop:720 length:399 start_codon:yes stop_codon:yes gene_type:complete